MIQIIAKIVIRNKILSKINGKYFKKSVIKEVERFLSFRIFLTNFEKLLINLKFIIMNIYDLINFSNNY